MEDRPSKLSVPLLVAVIAGLSVILSTIIVVSGLITIKNKDNFVTVTGSAKRYITSDVVIWRGSFSKTSDKLTNAYSGLSDSMKKVKDYLLGKGIKGNELTISSITTTPNYKYTSNGQTTGEIMNYKLDQYIEVKSKDISKISNVSRSSTELINQGIEFQSMPPQYYYSKIADIKVDILADATKNAKYRADKIAKSAGGNVGNLRSASMGVFQITPEYSNDVSDSGINDTTSIKKEITAVVNCSFEIK